LHTVRTSARSRIKTLTTHYKRVYVRNLDETVKIPALIEALHGLFDEFGTIVDIVAKKSLKRKGQAFVIYDNVDSAQNAIDDLQGFDLFGRQMNLDFAKTRSDATVKREDGEEKLEEHKKIRLAEKGTYRILGGDEDYHADSLPQSASRQRKPPSPPLQHRSSAHRKT
jgi:RNA recognition motif-containing protein